MSILKVCEGGWIISHSDYIKLDIVADELDQIKSQVETLRLNPKFFQLNSPFRRKVNKVNRSKKKSLSENGSVSLNSEENLESQLSGITKQVKDLGWTIIKEGRVSGIFRTVTESQKNDNNSEARQVALDFFDAIKGFQVYPTFCIENEEDVAFKTILFDSEGNFHNFLIPPKSVLYSDSISILNSLIDKCRYSLIVMDPPWRNKYVRRRKRKQIEACYTMMDSCDIGKLPIKELTNDKAIVAVWCTNSTGHQKSVIDKFFPSWGIDYLTTWYWTKVTTEGEPICPFNLENLKQPYETIILGRRRCSTGQFDEPLNTTKVIVSIPSSIHSHKPPLMEILRPYIFEKELTSSNCCELFARYALPNCTSIGNEVVKLLHDSLYV